ncbi:hypothetical protein NQ314_002956 [Rhamnusium bicolor]|uniref:Uncharacterized protein n=1 Tax=Rhamnusium bicolor TaxID=1586634 RepID=A0AAV8ZQC1_9CUCU|nr:hypothetical protein NQ314_002956 [Rhamnusium bicolor]
MLITLSHIKAFLQVQPRGWNILLECDVPFALPHDTRLFTRGKRQVIERKNLFKQLEVALTE